jgi:hypothetical protein
VALLPGAEGDFVLGLALFGARHEIVVRSPETKARAKVRPTAVNVARDGVLTAMVWAKIRLRPECLGRPRLPTRQTDRV